MGGVVIHTPQALLQLDFFAGYNKWTWAVVLNNSLNGLAISAILKHADNIARVYAHAVAMLVTMVLSVMFFGLSPTPQLIISIGVVAASAIQYNIKPSVGTEYKPAPQVEIAQVPSTVGNPTD